MSEYKLVVVNLIGGAQEPKRETAWGLLGYKVWEYNYGYGQYIIVKWLGGMPSHRHTCICIPDMHALISDFSILVSSILHRDPELKRFLFSFCTHELQSIFMDEYTICIYKMFCSAGQKNVIYKNCISLYVDLCAKDLFYVWILVIYLLFINISILFVRVFYEHMTLWTSRSLDRNIRCKTLKFKAKHGNKTWRGCKWTINEYMEITLDRYIATWTCN